MSSAKRAAIDAAELGLSFAEAARRHDVSREAVRKAWHTLYTAPPKRAGRPRAASPRSLVLTALVDGRAIAVRVSTEERDAFRAAAGETPIGTWLGEIWATLPRGRRTSTALRATARKACGLADLEDS